MGSLSKWAAAAAVRARLHLPHAPYAPHGPKALGVSQPPRIMAMIVGILLLVGFLTPLHERNDNGVPALTFSNLRALGSGELPGAVRVAVWFPLVAGGIILAASLTLKAMLRGIIMLALVLVAVLMVALLAGPRPPHVGFLLDSSDLIFSLGFLGIGLILSGTWIRIWLTESHAGLCLAIAGGLLALLGLFAPILKEGHCLVTKGLADADGPGRPLALVAILTLVPGALLSIAYLSRRASGRHRQFAGYSFGLTLGGVIIMILAFLATALVRTDIPLDAALLIMIKLFSLAAGGLLLLPVGLAELLLGLLWQNPGVGPRQSITGTPPAPPLL